jgi:fumarate hydratase subunit beta
MWLAMRPTNAWQEILESGEPLPFDPEGQIICYMGPITARPGRPIGSAGPTASCRVDPYAARLMEAGVRGMICKGSRSFSVREAMQRYRAVYFAAAGGAGALLAQAVISAQIIGYDDLGPGAVHRLVVEDFPAVVIKDVYGGYAYEGGQEDWARRSESFC